CAGIRSAPAPLGCRAWRVARYFVIGARYGAARLNKRDWRIAMARTPSTMLPLGTSAPDFKLMNVDGREVELADFAGKPALLVMLMCNQCPLVVHVADELGRLSSEYTARGVAVIGLNANDTATHPADSPERMVAEAEERGYQFPYLF